MNRRLGDSIKISGDYQYNAINSPNPVQRFWHLSKKLAIARFLPPRKEDFVMDVGCGSGVITSFLGESGAEVLGLDGNSEAIAFAAETFSKPNVQFQLGLVDEQFDTSRPVDKIYCLEVIEHIHLNQARDMLKAFRNLLNPHGEVFITTPNYASLWPLIEWLMDLFHLAPQMSVHQHVEHYNIPKLKRLCRETGFVVESVHTTNFIAPWLTPLSWRAAEKIDALESTSNLPFGSIIIVVLRKAVS
jgi:cyclopropane fatty-acyl-phospholipid synthase-like methyltransferase